MLIPPYLTRRGLLLAVSLLATATLPLRAQEAGSDDPPAPEAPVAQSIIGNSNMETDADGDGWPDGWPSLKNGGTWATEEGNRFIRMTSTTPGEMVMMYREISIPEGVEALQLTWRQQVTGLKKGSKSWFDVRIMMEFMDGNREKIGPQPKPAATGKDTNGWVERTSSFLVPEGARILKFMPALFNVQSGTFDMDDVVLVPTDAAPLRVLAAEQATARAEKLAANTAARQNKAAALLEAKGSILDNGDFETPDKKGGWPAHWPNLKANGSWGTDEDGNRFYRMHSTEPGKMVMAFRTLNVPAGVEALELSYRWRITDLKRGSKQWNDARIMMDFKDASGKKLKPQPSPPNTSRNTDGWVQKTTSFLVPEGAVTLDFMPALFEVKQGTLDLDDIVIKPTEAAALIARQQERERMAAKARVPVETDKKANWPAEIRAKGNRLVTVDGGKEVWLQGMNVASLEWSLRGEQVHKSTVVAIDEWKGNVIRLPVKDDYWFGKEADDGGKAYRAIVDQVITLAANRGAYVVLDLHRYRAPRQEYLTFWTDAATRYKNHPAVIFDLINEPHGISWEIWRNGGFVEEKKKDGDEDAFLTPEEKLHNKHGFQSPGMQAMLDTVRATGAKNLVLVGGLDYAYRLDGIVNGFGLEDKTGNGIMYACHIYPWKKGWQKYLLDAAALHPILLGEVGADAKKMDFMPHEIQEDWETWTPAILGLIQQHKLNWTGWCFHPKASPRMLLDWDYTPTPFWGQQAKDALSGKQFPPPDRLR